MSEARLHVNLADYSRIVSFSALYLDGPRMTLALCDVLGAALCDELRSIGRTTVVLETGEGPWPWIEFLANNREGTEIQE
jgi:hypothetical protein